MTRDEALSHVETRLLVADRRGASRAVFYIEALRVLGVALPTIVDAAADTILWSCSKVRDAISGT